MHLIPLCLRFPKKTSIFDLSSLKYKQSTLNKKLITIYHMNDKKDNLADLFFTKKCVPSENNKIFRYDLNPGTINIRKKDIRLSDVQIENIKKYYTQCNEYIINLPLSKLYMLFNIDFVMQKKSVSDFYFHEALLFQLYSQYKKRNHDNNEDILTFYKMISKHKMDGFDRLEDYYDLIKAENDYWKEVNKIIKKAPKIPENCPIILYRGSKNKEHTYNRPFSTSMNVLIAKNYQYQESGFLHIYKMNKGASILPLFIMDRSPEENEVLLSSDYIFTQIKDEKKSRYFLVSNTNEN